MPLKVLSHAILQGESIWQVPDTDKKMPGMCRICYFFFFSSALSPQIHPKMALIYSCPSSVLTTIKKMRIFNISFH